MDRRNALQMPPRRGLGGWIAGGPSIVVGPPGAEHARHSGNGEAGLCDIMNWKPGRDGAGLARDQAAAFTRYRAPDGAAGSHGAGGTARPARAAVGHRLADRPHARVDEPSPDRQRRVGSNARDSSSRVGPDRTRSTSCAEFGRIRRPVSRMNTSCSGERCHESGSTPGQQITQLGAVQAGRARGRWLTIDVLK